jgi:HEAT repeat protein
MRVPRLQNRLVVMNHAGPQLTLLFNESGHDPLILGSTWTGVSGREDPDFEEMCGPIKRIRALAIFFLLAKYREKRPVAELTFKPKIAKNTWVCTLTNNPKKVKPWIKRVFHVDEDNTFYADYYGSTHMGSLKFPFVRFRAENLPLSNLRLCVSSKSLAKEEIAKLPALSGLELVKYAILLEGEENEHWSELCVKLLLPDIYDKEGNEILPSSAEEDKSASLTPEFAQVCDFLRKLARKGLDKRMIFPPPGWQNRPLSAFCIEPLLMTEAQWAKQRKATHDSINNPHEMELADKATMWRQLRERPALLGQVLGDENHSPRHQRVILRGNPGEGKSTALWIHIGNQCKRLLCGPRMDGLDVNSPQFIVPLVLPLGEAKRSDASLVKLAIEKTMEIAFGVGQEVAAEELKKWLDEKVKSGAYSLALDAMDELSLTGDIDGLGWLHDQIQDIPHSVSILLTTRPNTADTALGMNIGQAAGHFEIYRMMCFDQRQISHYVRSYFGRQTEKVEFLLSRLQQSPGPRALARLPLLLATLCHTYDANDPAGSLASTQTELLGVALRCLFRSGHKKRIARFGKSQRSDPLRDRLKEILLQHIAWRFWKDGPVLIGDEDLDAELLKALAAIKSLGHEAYQRVKEPARRLKLPGFVEELCEDGILIQTLAKGQIHYRFVLRSLHEYLVAGYLALENNERTRKLVRSAIRNKDWSHPNWRYIWPLAAGQNSEIASGFLSSFDPPHSVVSEMQEDDGNLLPFLGRLIAECKSPLVSYWSGLLSSLIWWDIGLHEGIITALGEIGGPLAETTLLNWMLFSSGWPAGGEPEYLRVLAYRSLANVAMRETRNFLIQELNNPLRSPSSRGPCVQTLGRIGDTVCRDALITHLNETSNDENYNPRLDCVEMLGEIGDDQSREELIRQLQNKFNTVGIRLKAACSLQVVNDVKSRDALIAYLRDGDHQLIRERCALFLGVTDAVGRIALADALFTLKGDVDGSIRDMCAAVLAVHGGATTGSILIRRLNYTSKDQDTKVWEACAKALGELGGPENRSALLAKLHDVSETLNDSVRIACIDGLNAIGDQLSRESLIACLRSPINAWNVGIRYACAYALRVSRDSEHRSLLIARLNYPVGDDWGQRRCAWALGEIGGEEGRSALIQRLNEPSGDPKGEIRIECAKALAAIGGSESIAALAARFQTQEHDPTGGIRYACGKALGLIADPKSRPLLIAILLNSREDVGPIVPSECVFLLGQIGGLDSRSAIIACISNTPKKSLGSHWDRTLRACVNALGHIRDAVCCSTLIHLLRNSSDQELRIECAVVLSKIGDPESLTALIGILNNELDDEYEQLRSQCVKGIAEIGGDESRSALIARLRNPSYDKNPVVLRCCINALARAGDSESISALVDYLFDLSDDVDAAVAFQCIQDLSTWGGPTGRDALIRRLNENANDRTGIIRKVCAFGLGGIGDSQSCAALIARLNNPKEDEDGGIRSNCVVALGRIDDSKLQVVLIQRLLKSTDDANGWIRSWCVRILRARGDAKDRNAFRRCLAKKNLPANVRQQCYEAVTSSTCQKKK